MIRPMLLDRLAHEIRRSPLLYMLGWAAVVILIGLAAQIQAGWIAFTIILPAALVGLQALLQTPTTILTSAASPSPLAPVSSQSGILQARLRELAREIDRVSGALTNIVSQQGGAGEQSSVIMRAERTLEDFNEMSAHARREAVRLSAISQQTTNASRAGQQSSLQSIDGITKVQIQINEAAGTLGALARHLRQISKINATVNEIATQSNFLALNAAIEAARAGEQGRSFATVADEVRVLSDQSRNAVREIHEVLAQVHKAMEDTVTVTQGGAQLVESGLLTAQQTRDAVMRLSEGLSESSGAVQRILLTIDQQSSAIESLVKSINNVGQLTMQSQAGLRLAEGIIRDLNRLSEELNTIAAGSNEYAS
jgi:methyl-accepting chemotaxis protein